MKDKKNIVAHSDKTKAFEGIVHDYTDYVFNLAYRILGNSMDARDAVQETFIKLFRNFERYDEKRGMRNWICTIALNASRDIYRKRNIGGFKADIEECPVPADGNIALEMDRKGMVERILAGLSLEYRTVMVLFYLEEKSIKEMAEILSLPSVLVKVRLFRARKQIAKMVKDRGYER